MDDHEEAAAAARDPAALAEAPEDLNMAGATLHDDQRETTVAVGLNVPALAATARALRLDERNAAAETACQQDELRRYRQDMAPLCPDQPRLREDFNRGGGRGARVVRQSDVLVVAMECLPAPSAVWLRQGGHYEDNRTASTTPASMCLMQLSRHLIGAWSNILECKN